MIRVVRDEMLFVSEPEPSMFGNPENEAGNPRWSKETSNWLKSRFHFSFGEYHHPKNSSFGVLRALNDDVVQPRRGFGEHGQCNMDILTYVVDGELTHDDTDGHVETLGPGCTQYLTSGIGVRHCESNESPDTPLRYIQIWITPRKCNTPSTFGCIGPSRKDKLNQWFHLASDRESVFKTPVKLGQDANVYVSELEPAKTLTFHVGHERQAYLLCIKGNVSIESTEPSGPEELEILQHEAAEVSGDIKVKFKASNSKGASILIVEMELDGSSRFQ
mmetsp:Transcript_4933/g.9293  ORF Transcript_4933/g.9293 Transcript_4933/m.9293 type:complete len:275 (+) Transcript_4933:123-947(+)